MLEINGIDKKREDMITEIQIKFINYLNSPSFEKDLKKLPYNVYLGYTASLYYSISKGKITHESSLGDTCYKVDRYKQSDVEKQRKRFLKMIEIVSKEYYTLKKESTRVHRAHNSIWPTFMLNKKEFKTLIETYNGQNSLKVNNDHFHKYDIEFVNTYLSELLDSYRESVNINNLMTLYNFDESFVYEYIKNNNFLNFSDMHTKQLKNKILLNKYLLELLLSKDFKDKQEIVSDIILGLVKNVSIQEEQVFRSSEPVYNEKTMFENDRIHKYYKNIIEQVKDSKIMKGHKVFKDLKIEDLKNTTGPVLIVKDVVDEKAIDLLYSLSFLNIIFIYSDDSWPFNSLYLDNELSQYNRKTVSFYVQESLINNLKTISKIYNEHNDPRYTNRAFDSNLKSLSLMIESMNVINCKNDINTDKNILIYQTKKDLQ